MSTSQELLDAVFNHLVLPPNLPGAFDGDNVLLIETLGRMLQDACGTFRELCRPDERIWDTLEASIRVARVLNHEYLTKDDIASAFGRLDKEWLVLHVAKQNAALLVHREYSNETVIFEAFEVAAPTTQVLEAQHALTWDFPNRAVDIPFHELENECFIDILSEFLEQASSETFDKFAARALKGGKQIVETRDCPSPILINEMLMPLLEGIGQSVNVRTIRKRVRDDVVLGSSELPWRRSAYWLVLRVATRRLLSSSFNQSDKGIDQPYFKFLICILLAKFLKDCAGKLRPEKTLMLQAKLSRRLAKLESEKLAASGSLRLTYDELFGSTTDFFKATLGSSRCQVDNSWEQYKKNISRRIPTLPRRAPAADLQLKLVNSGSYLSRRLSQKTTTVSKLKNLNLSSLSEGTISQVNEMASRYTNLSDNEAIITTQVKSTWSDPRQRCCELSQILLEYLSSVGDAYKDDALLMSRYLLESFEVWVAMDQAATTACPLLKKYHPVFVPEALDVLCLLTLDEMTRLKDVQQYISGRITEHSRGHPSIFDDPNQIQAFTRYFSQTEDGELVTDLDARITAASDRSKASKKGELASLMNKYNQLSEAIQIGVCCCTRLPDGSKDVKGCKVCWQRRSRKRLKIDIHEDFLPCSDSNKGRAQRAAVLFELNAPGYLTEYRMATWKLRLLGSQPVKPTTPTLLLKQCGNLSPFWNRSKRSLSFTLASDQKAFAQTHYKKLKLPKSETQILLPFGPRFHYYDCELGVWASDLDPIPWFQHLLGFWIPKEITDPYNSPEKSNKTLFPPSSYQIAANSSNCPSGMSVHEFSAFQRAISGRSRRLLVLIVELGATNLNLSNETTMTFVNHLVLQAGPIVDSKVLREIHCWFSDPTFCARLCEQLSNWLDTIVSNWREVFSMSILVTLTLRLHHLSPQGPKMPADELLSRIRKITSGWIGHLRREVRSTNDSEVARKAAKYAFWAALLCRQTFSVYSDTPGCDETLRTDDLRHFFQASIALQENLLVNLDELGSSLKALFIRDLCMSYSMRKIVKKWIVESHTLLEEAINETWTDGALSGSRVYSPWSFLPQKHSWWAQSRISATQRTTSQIVHYHILQGHLLVDGKPLGRLPLDVREDPDVRELFGQQHLLTRPSNLNGMQYQLVNKVENHQIHIGLTDGKVTIRAIFKNSLLELVPRDIFKSPSGIDLPLELVDDCVHWLNLDTGKLEMRRKPKIWRPKLSNWILDVRNHSCIRNKMVKANRGFSKPGSSLIEPRSKIGTQIAAIFEGFEDVGRLTIYQPIGSGSLTVEMKRLEIRFSVNRQNLLQCPQLASEIDPDQDSGTFYGLSSQIVLRSVLNPERRSIIVPIGRKFSWRLNGMHVSVNIVNEGMYARFTIDSLLGRLDCAQEQNILHLKTALHALTSFCLPDPLTERTGTEEAVHCLTSACSQPWTPLPDLSKHYLLMLKSLTPRRHYYPQGFKSYQKVEWNRDLTTTVQYEGLATLAEGILQHSEKLGTFQLSEPRPTTELRNASTSHLNLRGLIRRQIYERIRSPSDSLVLASAAKLLPYVSKDSPKGEGRKVYEIVKMLRTRPSEIPKLANLAPLFKYKESIGGFQHSFKTINIGELIDVDIFAVWGTLVQTCRKQDPSAPVMCLFLLALLVLNIDSTSAKILRWLVAITKQPNLSGIVPPPFSTFNQLQGSETPQKEGLAALIMGQQLDHSGYLKAQRTKRARKSALVRVDFEQRQRSEAQEIAHLLVQQWPNIPRDFSELENLVQGSTPKYIDTVKAWDGLKPEFDNILRNHALSRYLNQLQNAADQIPQYEPPGYGINSIRYLSPQPTTIRSLVGGFKVPQLVTDLASKTHHSFDDLDVTSVSRSQLMLPTLSVSAKPSSEISSLPSELLSLSAIIDSFASSGNATQRQYGEDLRSSFQALVQHRQATVPSQQPPGNNETVSRIHETRQALKRLAESIRGSFSRSEEGYKWLAAGNLWPCSSPVALLELLRNGNRGYLGPGMGERLVSYGVLITELQRLERIHNALRCNDTRRLLEESNHTGHSNWRPIDQPEWLLLEIDNNMLIRPPQVDVAKAVVSPSTSSNSVLQMNMGQGKTSCIMPMATTMLADKTRLCRLIVPRALLLQTALVMQRRIGRLIGRSVQHIPFERRSPKNHDTLALYRRIHQDTLESGGVMLCLPEHILSFQLSGLQQIADGDMSTARIMIETQHWIHESSRDILDESDLTLSPKTQLIYPKGSPVIVDGNPHRWEVVQDLLALAEGHFSSLESKLPDSIQIFRRHRGYPIVHFLNIKAENALNALLIKDICEGRLARVQLADPLDLNAKSNIELIVSGVHTSDSTWQRAANYLEDDVFGLKSLYLLRGLISERIIILCLKKRWNVQFGLHPERAPIAVPYEAKGVPSPTAEYGHPDTALILTCLAFYQTGLSQDQVTRSLHQITTADDPTTQFEHWVHGCQLPPTLRHVSLLSTDDEAQMEELWRLLRFDRHVLNHYMNTFVFPRHAKQFGVKIQASGWDIPLLSNSSSLTTGFSGTNDNKRLLPQNIRQDDLPSLLHTNAEVLSHLLQERNMTCHRAVDYRGQHLTEMGLLELLQRENIRVLIDAGAHILEMENHDLAAAWLEVDFEAQGAVYFDQNGRIMVKARFQNSPMPLQASSFADNMESCVVYIDEAHTRGTDLKLPVYAKGAVTLGMGQTKDQTVQAAMRLRQLASTQSVAFVAPPEVYQSLLDLRPADHKVDHRADSHDVVRWLLAQSCKANEDIFPLHIAQGFDFCRRANALWKHKDQFHEKKSAKKLLNVILQREDQSIEELYGPRAAVPTKNLELNFPQLQTFSSRLHQLRASLPSTAKVSSALAEVEQEREVEFEVEQVREKQKEGLFQSLTFPGLDPYICKFVQTGMLDLKGPFIQAFDFVGMSKIGRKFGVTGTGSQLFISEEFSRTVVGFSSEVTVVRPVEWILWSPRTETALVVIPEEAELLIPRLRGCDKAPVYLLSYAPPVTKSMQAFNTLSFFTVPSQERHCFPNWLPLEVGIFAGRLYFDYSEYKSVLSWLGVDSHEGLESLLSSSLGSRLCIKQPFKFLLEWLTFRREIQDITHSPMGYVCQRRILRPDHSFFASVTKVGKLAGQAPLCRENGDISKVESDEDSDWGGADDAGMDDEEDM